MSLCPGSAEQTDRRLPVVCGRLLERHVELEPYFSGFEGALRLEADDPVVFHGHYQIGLGPIPHLAGRKPHTCKTHHTN